jgi:uncharacterized protein (TIGR02246 family)
MTPRTGQPAAPADVDSVRAIVRDVEAGFNDNDWALSVAHVAADAVLVSAMGTRLAGRPAVEEAMRAGLSSGPLGDATAHYRVTDVTALAPDVLVASKDAWSTDAAADAGEPPEMRALYVLARRQGRWWIARRQNTLVAAPPAG